ncbi:FAD-dependent oxidoreductase [Streptomyces piniterrae]|uniref:FAD-dependent oxidoreductase n=1 Tax=Streptomyces piniterrae TaxID=2571125 RepID=A0A4U0NDJ7_9ACTN|nr:FAD-dependent oxidoreductase [Streptomyces piniterrae]TJZ51873.1 FAD-dependent oxidoreductase [Streptomyces piniterrae]
MKAANRKPSTTVPTTDPTTGPSTDRATGPAAGPASDPTTDPATGSEISRSDVIVVGAGPTGLLLAGDLAEAGLDVTLLERRPHTTSNLTRALVVHARTLEQLDARGLADELVAGGYPLTRLRLFGSATLDPSRLPSRFPFVLVTPQFEVERLLERRARQAGVTFRYESEVLGLQQDGDGVTVRVREADGVHRARAAYLVGTDGVRSTIRETLGLPFPGKSALRSLVLADVRLAQEPDSPFTVNATTDAFAVIAPFGDGWYRVIGWNRRRQAADDVPADLDEVRELARLALGSDYGMHDARWISRFHSDERQVPDYRVGRVFLAGDAAHVHSPAGGMGMNTGLQDAANLSWKLAAVLQGHAPAGLLDSYQAERHPVGKLVLRLSGTILRVGLLHRAPGRAARALAAGLINRLRPLSGRAIRTVSGLAISYPAERGAHPLAGRRAPDVRLADGSRLYELLRQGKFVLITPVGDTGDPQPSADRVVCASWTGGRRTALLVRPDGYIAWATDATAPAERAAGIRTALTRWTGAVAEPEGSIRTASPASVIP